jgi:hypothetical protein
MDQSKNPETTASNSPEPPSDSPSIKLEEYYHFERSDSGEPSSSEVPNQTSVGAEKTGKATRGSL